MKNSKPNIVVLGSINMDLVVRCATLPVPGQTILAESAAEFCGGKGANQAVAAARSGADVTMIGCVGDDAFADRLVRNLDGYGVNTQAIKRCEDCPSGLAVIAVEQTGQNLIMVVPGANGRLCEIDVEHAEAVIAASDMLLVQLEVPVDTVLSAIRIAKKNNVRVVLDPAPAPSKWKLELLQVDLLCPNESEAAALVGQPIETTDQASKAAQTLRDMGAQNVAITMGDQGTLLCQSERTQLIPPYSVNAVDTTAAGDAFAGALAVHWAQHECLVDAVRFANAAGALAASRAGAQSSMASRQEIETFWSVEQ